MTKEQRKWAREHMRLTGFEALGIDECEKGIISFRAMVARNKRWFQMWYDETERLLEAYASVAEGRKP